MSNFVRQERQLGLSLFLQVACWVLLCCGNNSLVADDANADLDGIRFPLGETGIPLLPVKLLGKEINCLVDPTANFQALDQQFRPQLSLAKSRVTVILDSRYVSIDIYDAPEMVINSGAGIPFHPGDQLVCVDLSKILASSFGIECGGRLGAEFLKSRILRLNFDEQYFEFPGKPSLDWPHRERVRVVGGQATVVASLPDEFTPPFRLGTAVVSYPITLDSATFDRLLKKKKIAQVWNSIFVGPSGEVIRRRGVLESLDFGPHRFFNLTVAESDANVLGISFLRRFNLELDWPNETLRFRPSRWIDLPDRRDRSGFHVMRWEGKTFLVIENEEIGPAAEAGMKKADRLVKINGLDADRLTHSEIRNLCIEPGAELQIVYEHDGVTREVLLKLTNEPDPFPAKSPHEVITSNTGFEP